MSISSHYLHACLYIISVYLLSFICIYISISLQYICIKMSIFLHLIHMYVYLLSSRILRWTTKYFSFDPTRRLGLVKSPFGKLIGHTNTTGQGSHIHACGKDYPTTMLEPFSPFSCLKQSVQHLLRQNSWPTLNLVLITLQLK